MLAFAQLNLDKVYKNFFREQKKGKAIPPTIDMEPIKFLEIDNWSTLSWKQDSVSRIPFDTRWGNTLNRQRFGVHSPKKEIQGKIGLTSYVSLSGETDIANPNPLLKARPNLKESASPSHKVKGYNNYEKNKMNLSIG